MGQYFDISERYQNGSRQTHARKCQTHLNARYIPVLPVEKRTIHQTTKVLFGFQWKNYTAKIADLIFFQIRNYLCSRLLFLFQTHDYPSRENDFSKSSSKGSRRFGKDSL